MACGELTDFLGNIEQKIGKESYEIITNTLRELYISAYLDVIFAKSKLPQGSRKILDYHWDLLRNESPLSKPKPQRTDPAGEESSADSKPKVRHCFTQNSCKYKSTSWKFVLRVYASFSDDCENAFLTIARMLSYVGRLSWSGKFLYCFFHRHRLQNNMYFRG